MFPTKPTKKPIHQWIGVNMASLLQWIVAKPNKIREGKKMIQQDNTFTQINTLHSLHDEQ